MSPTTEYRCLPPSPKRRVKALLRDSYQASARGTRSCLGFRLPADQAAPKPSGAWTTGSPGSPSLPKLGVP